MWGPSGIPCTDTSPLAHPGEAPQPLEGAHVPAPFSSPRNGRAQEDATPTAAPAAGVSVFPPFGKADTRHCVDLFINS